MSRPQNGYGYALEALTKKKVREYLNEIGAYTFMPVQMGMGSATLDYLCCYKGRFLAIETKARGKQPTARQRLIANAMKDAGALVVLAYEAADVQKALDAAGLLPTEAPDDLFNGDHQF